MSEQKQNEMQNLGFLDLRGMTSPEDLKGMKKSNIGLVLVPETMVGSLIGNSESNIGAVVPIPDGEKVTVLAGNTKLTRDILEAGEEDTILIVAGMTLIPTQIEKISYKELRFIGMLLAPKGSESIIFSKLTLMSGEMIFYAGNPRIEAGNESWNRAFLEMLPGTTTYFLTGCQLVIEDDVTADLLKDKIAEIQSMGGNITAPSALLPVLHTLVVNKGGVIQAKA